LKKSRQADGGKRKSGCSLLERREYDGWGTNIRKRGKIEEYSMRMHVDRLMGEVGKELRESVLLKREETRGFMYHPEGVKVRNQI